MKTTILLAALGLSGPLFGTRLLPVGTVYDPFIARGLDSLNYACYQDARFIIVGTPSGIAGVLEYATDKAEDAANVLEAIVVKST